jgi:hypothetical protein
LPDAVEDPGEEDTYKDPDFFYKSPNAKTFIYTIDNELYYESGRAPHNYLEIMHADDLLGDYKREAEAQTDGYFEARELMSEHYALYGRLGWHESRLIISFWNITDEIYRLLGGCLKALEREHLIESNGTAEIHTPFDISVYDIASGETRRLRETDPDQLERTKLLQRLHLMNDVEKKAARKKLGLWSAKPTKHPWQKEMEKTGDVSPGQKWWAPQSEQIEGISRCIEEDI